MELKEFTQKVEKAMSLRLGEESDVRITMIRKNNNVQFTGLIIKMPGSNVYPTIYLEPYWNLYESGTPLGEVVERILTAYRDARPNKGIDFSFFEDFDKVKEGICFRLINGERNAELLEQIPYVPFWDLAICFYYSYENTFLGRGSIQITNVHMEKWGIKLKELWKLAWENTPRLYPATCHSMKNMLMQLMNHSQEDVEYYTSGLNCKLDVLTNESGCYGACCILYPEFLEQLAQEKGCDCYILPSSVHEVILYWEETGDTSYLKKMVREINEQEVSPLEVLSDSVYYYSRKDKKIKRIL